VTLLLAVCLLVSLAIPAAPVPDARQSRAEAQISGPARSESLPILNDRQERPAISIAREMQVTLPVDILEAGPVVHGAVILPVRNDVRLSAYFVYTQTTSSRL
jgi:hypothetical protein